MYVDEKIAYIEKQILASDEQDGGKEVRLTLKETINDVKNGSVTLSKEQKLEFERKYYFNNQVSMIQIKDFYSAINEDENEVCMSREESDLLQRFILSNDMADKWEESFHSWVIDSERNCRNLKIDFVPEKIKTAAELCYCCYKIKTGSKDYYNILFQAKYIDVYLKGTFQCLLRDRDIYGIVLEALLRASFESQTDCKEEDL